MDKEEFGEYLVNTIPNAKYASGKRAIKMRCPLCGDSSNPRSSHFYILLNPEYPNLLIRCYCHLCHASFILNHQNLLDWGIYDSEINVQLSEFNRRVSKEQSNIKFIGKTVYNLNNRFILDNELSRYKLNYINKRLGINIGYKDLLKIKVVLNLGDLLDSNKIYEYTRDGNILQELNDNFIGFISRDNAFITMRKVTNNPVHENIDKRYIVYSIFGKFDNSQRNYTIPTDIDITNPNRIRLNIAEGPFDILSVYYNMCGGAGHSIYSAVGGNGYLNLIKNFIINDKLSYIEVHVYIDNDVKDFVIRNIKDYLSVFNIPLFLHKNMKDGEKDFGVSLDKIQERVDRLL